MAARKGVCAAEQCQLPLLWGWVLRVRLLDRRWLQTMPTCGGEFIYILLWLWLCLGLGLCFVCMGWQQRAVGRCVPCWRCF